MQSCAAGAGGQSDQGGDTEGEARAEDAGAGGKESVRRAF
jgi:hypothetical protein